MKTTKSYLTVYGVTVAVLTVAFYLTFSLNSLWAMPKKGYFIPLFFVVMGLVSAFVGKVLFGAKREGGVQQSWLIYRMVKIVLSLALLILYAIYVGGTFAAFTISFMVFYFILMILETIHFFILQKNNKVEDK